MKTNNSSKTLIRTGLILIFFWFLHAGFVAAPLEVNIDIAPNIINLQAQTNSITVHTDIKFSIVNCNSISLNEVSPRSCFADECGFFVGKFRMSDFNDLIPGEYNLMILNGSTIYNFDFSGSQEIKVTDVKKFKK